MTERRTALPNGESGTLRELWALFVGFKELMDERQEHQNQLLKLSEIAVDKAFLSSQTAIDKADAARNLHDAAVNEWRQQYNAQELKFQPKAEYDAKMKDIAVLFDRYAGELNAFPTKTEVSGKFSVLDNELDRHNGRLQSLEMTRTEQGGRSSQTQAERSQSNATLGLVLIGVGLLVTAIIGLAGVLVNLLHHA